MVPDAQNAAAGETSRRLFFYNAGFLRDRRLRRILTLAGYQPRLGRPRAEDVVGVWGQSPYAQRGEAVSARTGAGLIRVEDAFLRAVLPARVQGGAPIGLVIDDLGVHFDPAKPSRLEKILAEHPLDDTSLLDAARAGMTRMRGLHLSKYNNFDPEAPVPPPGYVLIIDQTEGDASVRASRANRNRFLEMLFEAREAHPRARIVVKTHPETAAGARGGHFRPEDMSEGMELFDRPASPWALFEGAIAVYTVSSQMGFEAILAGHRPVVYGQPFYAGWGLSEDMVPLARRQRRLTRAQLFAAAMILYPVWYDPYHDRLCDLDTAISTLAAETRAWREDRRGWVASGMRLWKRAHLQGFFGATTPVRFAATPEAGARDAAAEGRRHMTWGAPLNPAPAGTAHCEDGFLRSRGLGAQLVPPLSLVLDDSGIYHDPRHPSRLEHLIAARATLAPHEAHRAEALMARLRAAGLSKYNLEGRALPDIPAGHRILVPGQVEDDASIRLGAGEVRTNAALLQAVRAANPDAVIMWKPHPDVEAGLRPGKVDDAAQWADVTLSGIGAQAAIATCDEVWTMTSTLGFEALMRERPVVCLGAPFYAGWGLTRDLGAIPARRTARPTLAGLVHAVLIDYPRYLDPLTGRPAPVEVIVERLAAGITPRRGPAIRILSKLQGVAASYAHLWR